MVLLGVFFVMCFALVFGKLCDSLARDLRKLSRIMERNNKIRLEKLNATAQKEKTKQQVNERIDPTF